MSNKYFWRVHTDNLLKEILSNPSAGILEMPLNIFGKLLAQVGERAAELNDPKLNELMIRLTIYSVADPESPDYDEKVVDQYLAGLAPPGLRRRDMRFNQIVWDALCFAAQRNIGHEDALHAYASDCDGNAKITYKARTGGIHTAEFIPNPDVKC